MRPALLLLFCPLTASAAAPITLALSTRTIGCSKNDQAEFTASVERTEDFKPEVFPRMIAIWRWFHSAGGAKPSTLFELSVRQPGEDPQTIAVDSYRILGGDEESWTPNPRAADPATFKPPDFLRVCLNLDRDLPAGSLEGTLKFLAPAHPTGKLADDLTAVTNRSLAGPLLPAIPTTVTRSFTRELDFAALLLSSVQDKTSSGQTVRTRDTKAAFDLWLAPILRLPGFSLKPGVNWFTYFTPIAIEAHASTQSINRDTLSQNRIVLGPEYEFRYYLGNGAGKASSNVLRFTAMFKDASDRDFKVNEPKFVAEFRPVWGRANKDVRDPKLVRNLPTFRLTRGDKIGRRLAPFFGFETGSTYSRGIPSSALRALGPFTRGYLGIEAGLDFNRKFAVNTTQILYIRGELNNDVVHYMRNSAQWTILGSTPQFLSQLQFTYEKGQLPPFRSYVNSLSLGIRVLSSNWGPSR